MYTIKPNQKQIDSQLDLASDWENAGKSAVPGMTFEQGVAHGIRWIVGEEPGVPIESAPEE